MSSSGLPVLKPRGLIRALERTVFRLRISSLGVVIDEEWRMPKIVSDSTPLIHLAKIGLLDLLCEHFGGVIVPPAVWRDVVEEGGDTADGRAVGEAKWINVQPIEPSSLLTDTNSRWAFCASTARGRASYGFRASRRMV